MRSAALPPMGACGAMQLRRDGVKRSLRTGAAELSEARAILLGSFASTQHCWRKKSYADVFPLSLPF